MRKNLFSILMALFFIVPSYALTQVDMGELSQRMEQANAQMRSDDYSEVRSALFFLESLKGPGEEARDLLKTSVDLASLRKIAQYKDEPTSMNLVAWSQAKGLAGLAMDLLGLVDDQESTDLIIEVAERRFPGAPMIDIFDATRRKHMICRREAIRSLVLLQNSKSLETISRIAKDQNDNPMVRVTAIKELSNLMEADDEPNKENILSPLLEIALGPLVSNSVILTQTVGSQGIGGSAGYNWYYKDQPKVLAIEGLATFFEKKTQNELNNVDMNLRDNLLKILTHIKKQTGEELTSSKIVRVCNDAIKKLEAI